MPSKPFRFHPGAREEFRDARNVVAASQFRAAGSAAVREVVRAPQRQSKYLVGSRSKTTRHAHREIFQFWHFRGLEFRIS